MILFCHSIKFPINPATTRYDVMVDRTYQFSFHESPSPCTALQIPTETREVSSSYKTMKSGIQVRSYKT
jgi:hypothetical protein